MSWRKITKIEPELRELYKTAVQYKKEAKRDKDFCANNTWVLSLKPVLCGLVGWEARNEKLRTCEAYDIAYYKIYNALPRCRHEGMFC